MKLDQLGLTPAGKKATKKLGSQVHKATVAAGMEPKLRLGVVGIEIGQEQSSGMTSMTEAVGPANAWSLISKLAATMEVPLRFKQADFDRDEAATDAVKIMRVWAKDNTAGNNIKHQLASIRMYVTSNGVFEQLKNAGESLPVFGFNPVGWFQDGLEANAVLVNKAKSMADHCTAVEEITDFLSLAFTTMSEVGDDNWKSYASFVRAVFKKLNII